MQLYCQFANQTGKGKNKKLGTFTFISLPYLFGCLRRQSSHDSVFCAGVRRAVDLCAAPGSWSQVLSRKLR